MRSSCILYGDAYGKTGKLSGVGSERSFVEDMGVAGGRRCSNDAGRRAAPDMTRGLCRLCTLRVFDIDIYLRGRMQEPDENTYSEKRKETETTQGRSLLPIARVQKIVKADKVGIKCPHCDRTPLILHHWQELPLVAREAVFAISVATV
jgi:hypothetical protein